MWKGHEVIFLSRTQMKTASMFFFTYRNVKNTNLYFGFLKLDLDLE